VHGNSLGIQSDAGWRLQRLYSQVKAMFSSRQSGLTTLLTISATYCSPADLSKMLACCSTAGTAANSSTNEIPDDFTRSKPHSVTNNETGS